MSQSKADVHQQETGQEAESQSKSGLTEKKRIETIGRGLDRVTAICCLLLPYFDKTSQGQPTDKTMHHSLNSMARELSQIELLIEASEKKEKLARFTGYQLELATKAIEGLQPHFDGLSDTQPDNETIYKDLACALEQMEDFDKTLAVYAEVYGQT